MKFLLLNIAYSAAVGVLVHVGDCGFAAGLALFCLLDSLDYIGEKK